MAKSDTTRIIAILALAAVAIAVFAPGIIPGQGQAPAAAAGTTPAQPATLTQTGAAVCAVEDTTQKFDVRDIENASTQPDVNAFVFVNGSELSPISNINSGGSTTVSPGDSLRVIYHEDATTSRGANDYYGKSVELGAVACSGIAIAKDTVAKEGSVDPVLFNKNETGTLSEPCNYTDDVNLAAGETITLKLRLDGNLNDAYWGSPYSSKGPLVVFDYNKDVIKKVEPAGISWTNGSVPNVYTAVKSGQSAYVLDLTTGGVSGVVTKASIKEYGQVSFKILVEAQSGSQPVTPGRGLDDINYTLFDAQWYQDQQDGWVEGYENNDTPAQIGSDNPAGVVCLN